MPDDVHICNTIVFIFLPFFCIFVFCCALKIIQSAALCVTECGFWCCISTNTIGLCTLHSFTPKIGKYTARQPSQRTTGCRRAQHGKERACKASKVFAVFWCCRENTKEPL